MFTQENVWTSMNVKLFLDSAWVVLVKIPLVVLNASVLRVKVWMKITFAKMRMNVQLSMEDKRFVLMDNVSIGILDTFVFVIQDTFHLKTRKLAWMPDKGTVTMGRIVEIHYLTNCLEWIVVAILDNLGVNLDCPVKVVLQEDPKKGVNCVKA